MKDNIDDSLNELLGSRRNIYTNEEINAAKKRQKKEGKYMHLSVYRRF